MLESIEGIEEIKVLHPLWLIRIKMRKLVYGAQI
jgi:hypothetical protein